MAAKHEGRWTFSKCLHGRGRNLGSDMYTGHTFSQKHSSLPYLSLPHQVQCPDECGEVNILSNGFSILQLKISGFGLALVPTTCSINSIKMSVHYPTLGLLNSYLKKKKQQGKTLSNILFNWPINIIICFINLFSFSKLSEWTERINLVWLQTYRCYRFLLMLGGSPVTQGIVDPGY